MKTQYTVSPHKDGYAVFNDGELHTIPLTGTWGAAKKIANQLNDDVRPTHMKYKPMLAKDGKEFLHGPKYQVERKMDGMRALFELNGDTKIWSRTGQDLRGQFPELLQLHETIGVACVLDGEIVSFIDTDKEDLEHLQFRISKKDPSPQLIAAHPVTVVFFDVLEAMNRGVTAQPLSERRPLLELILADSGMECTEILEGGNIPSHWEGVISKEKSSRYECGKRRVSWSKYKFVHRATLWAVELTPGIGARKSSFGAIVVEDENGRPRGHVGSGFTFAQLQEAMDLMAKGRFLIEVEYRFLGKNGAMVNTAYKGQRTDKEEADRL